MADYIYGQVPYLNAIYAERQRRSEQEAALAQSKAQAQAQYDLEQERLNMLRDETREQKYLDLAETGVSAGMGGYRAYEMGKDVYGKIKGEDSQTTISSYYTNPQLVGEPLATQFSSYGPILSDPSRTIPGVGPMIDVAPPPGTINLTPPPMAGYGATIAPQAVYGYAPGPESAITQGIGEGAQAAITPAAYGAPPAAEGGFLGGLNIPGGVGLQQAAGAAGVLASGYGAYRTGQAKGPIPGAGQGAITGAAAGTAILPGLGTAIGAGIGLVSGLVGGFGSDKKDMRRQQFAEAARNWQFMSAEEREEVMQAERRLREQYNLMRGGQYAP